MASRHISKYILGKAQNESPIEVVIPILDLLLCLIFLYIWIAILNHSLIFIPNSFLAAIATSINFLNGMTIITNALNGMIAETSHPVDLIFIILNAISSSSVFFTCKIHGGFCSFNLTLLVQTASLSSFINLTIFTVISLSTYIAKIEMLFILLGIFILFYLGIMVWFTNDSNKMLMHLDSFTEDHNYITDNFSPNQVLSIVMVGLRHAHPALTNFSLLKAVIDIFPNNVYIWFLFAKIVAIYPSENTTLAWIKTSFATLNIKGILAEKLEAKISLILGRRISTLNPNLKIKLCGVLDVTLQENIPEIETIVDSYMNQVKKTEVVFKHLLVDFPNNSFVMRSYSKFLLNIKSDEIQGKEFLDNSYKLLHGLSTFLDQPHELGLLAFPLLLDQIQNAFKLLGENMNLNDAESLENSVSFDVQVQKVHINETIDNLSIPTIKTNVIIHMFVFIFIGIVYFLFFYLYLYFSSESLMLPLETSCKLSELMILNALTSSLSNQYLYEKKNIIPGINLLSKETYHHLEILIFLIYYQ
jgi:hypothetical protein